MMRNFLVFVFFLLAGDRQLMALIPIQTQTLPNGLQVVVVNNPLTPTVSVGVLYKVGTADDPRDEVGLSHFVEHLMFKGTKAMPGDAYDKALIKAGGMHNACTYFDWTMYTADVAVEHLEMVISLEADRMENLSFQAKEVESERGVVLEERGMRTDNHPFGLAYELIIHSLNQYHPYGIPPIGYPHHIKAYTYESVFKHYRTWYAPNNAVLIVVGPVQLDVVMKWAEKYFGVLKSRPVSERKRPDNPVVDGATQHIVQYNKRNANIHLIDYYRGTAFRLDPKLSDALAVVAQMLGGHPTSEVYKKFVEDETLCLSISGSYEDDTLDASPFSVSAVLGAHQSVEKFRKAWGEYWHHLREKGAKQEEVDHAKKALLMSTNFMSDDNSGMVMNMASLACGQSVDDIARMAERIEAVTLEDVNKALKFLSDIILRVDLYPESMNTSSKQN